MKSRATHIEAFYFPLLLDQLYYFKISVANIEMREIDNFITLYFSEKHRAVFDFSQSLLSSNSYFRFSWYKIFYILQPH